MIGRSKYPNKIGACVSLFSGYENPKPIKTVSLFDFLLQPTYKKQVEEIRACTDKEIRRKMKSKLPAITPGGIFRKRCNSGLINFSGFIGIDIDGDDNPGIADFNAVKRTLIDLPGLCYAGLSASGNGLFLLMRVMCPERHDEHYSAIVKDLADMGLTADVQCRDIARLRGASYDPEPYFNPEVDVYSKLLTPAKPEPSMPVMKYQFADMDEYRAGLLVKKIQQAGIDITDDYRTWFSIGCSLAAGFRENGRDWFHTVSSQSPKYNSSECDVQYDRCLKSCTRTSISTFFWYCREYGITTTS